MVEPEPNRIKSSTTHELTSVPGWDSVTQEYIELDCERWIRENGIRDAGQENGEQEFPPSNATQFDEMYAKIRDWVNKRGRSCHAEVAKFLTLQRNALIHGSTQGSAPVQQKIDALREEGKVALNNQGQEDRNVFAQKEREARDALTALEQLRNQAGLTRVAEYEGRYTWYWWLVGVMTLETLANAMMLADVNEYGLLGAVIVMVAICFVNAFILGAVIGEGWRQKNAVSLAPRLVGFVMVLSGSAGLIYWNLLVGHFRDSMRAVATRVTERIGLDELLTDDTIERFLASPLGLEDMMSWILAVIGASCCVFAATKWLSRDDPYPGYGELHRTASDHSGEYSQEIANRRKNLKSVYTKYLDKIHDEQQKLENKKGSHQLVTDTVHDVITQFPMQLSQYQDNLNFILAAYRSANEKARTTPPPAFFNERVTVDSSILVPPEIEDVPEPVYDDDWGYFKQAEDEIRAAYETILETYPILEDLMEVRE